MCGARYSSLPDYSQDAVLNTLFALYAAEKSTATMWSDAGDNGVDLAANGADSLTFEGGQAGDTSCIRIPECQNTIVDAPPFMWVAEEELNCGGACPSCGCGSGENPCENGGACVTDHYTPSKPSQDNTCDCSGVDYSGATVSCCFCVSDLASSTHSFLADIVVATSAPTSSMTAQATRARTAACAPTTTLASASRARARPAGRVSAQSALVFNVPQLTQVLVRTGDTCTEDIVNCATNTCSGQGEVCVDMLANTMCACRGYMALSSTAGAGVTEGFIGSADLSTTNAARSAEMWIRLDGTTTQLFFSYGTTSGADISLGYVSGTGVVLTIDGASVTLSGSFPADSTFHHVAFSHHATDGSWEYWVDGASVSTSSSAFKAGYTTASASHCLVRVTVRSDLIESLSQALIRTRPLRPLVPGLLTAQHAPHL